MVWFKNYLEVILRNIPYVVASFQLVFCSKCKSDAQRHVFTEGKHQPEV